MGVPEGDRYEESEEEMLNKLYTPPTSTHRQYVEKKQEQLSNILPLPVQGKPLFVIQKDLKSIPDFLGTQENNTVGKNVGCD